jgi:N-acetylglucosamine malate deacetylase 1
MKLRNYIRSAYRATIPFLYARTNYKLFLKTTFNELNNKILTQICATNVLQSVLRPVPMKAPFGKSMLIVAPHQDDEIIGCGGAMLLQKESGRSVSVVFVNDGGNEHEEDGISREAMVGIRESEARKVASEAGIGAPKFLRYSVLNMQTVSAVSRDLLVEIRRTNADTIFVPFFLDTHPDHMMTNVALAQALEAANISPLIYGYEVWTLCIANVIIKIDSVMERKRKLLSLYVSQVTGTDYVHTTTGLNMYHSRAFGSGSCKYAERFFQIPAVEYVGVIKKMQQKTFSS